MRRKACGQAYAVRRTAGACRSTPTLGGLSVHRAAKKVAKWYGTWALALLAIAVLGNYFSGNGEYGVSTHLWLTITGLPLSLLSWYVPNGTVLGVLVAGLIGTAQWTVVAEANARWKAWRQRRQVKNP